MAIEGKVINPGISAKDLALHGLHLPQESGANVAARNAGVAQLSRDTLLDQYLQTRDERLLESAFNAEQSRQVYSSMAAAGIDVANNVNTF